MVLEFCVECRRCRPFGIDELTERCNMRPSVKNFTPRLAHHSAIVGKASTPNPRTQS
ncbi:hypothetical protein PLICRDRAFT_606726 [Plicaturopsis crispa FD-325 SS-3]|nr:hypothetical protein PLICRDRAFT_606726 [Plicaturopsis crispa FD-325 SS-3]